MAYAKAAKKVQQADRAEATETIIGADVNASHPYKDGTYNDLNVNESPQQVAERKHAEKAAAWKTEHHARQKEADQLASAKKKVERVATDEPTTAAEPEPTAAEADREVPEIGPHSSARAERMAKKAAKKAKKSFYITNDPFFVVNGKKGHFWLPAGAPAKLLSVPFPDASHSVALLGETFGDGEASQWFKTYTLAVNGEHLVKVEVSDKPGELMRTMKVWTPGGARRRAARRRAPP